MLPIEPAFKVITDRNGKPLENGYVYFGLPNLNPITSPIAVYWDIAGTQPALQALRTVNGYIVRSGTPANVFVGASYSMLVLDHKGRQVFYARNSEEFSIATIVANFITTINAIIANLAGPTGSSLVGFIQNLVGAVLGTMESKARERVSLLDFMDADLKAVVKSGLYDAGDRAAMLVAVNAAWASAIDTPHDLYAPVGRYEIGNNNFPWRQSVPVGLQDCKNVTIYCDGPATVFATFSPEGADVFQLNAIKNFHVRGFPTLTGLLSGASLSGSNGCSVTGGYDNITLEISPTNCQSVDKGDTNDGGKGFSIQCDGADEEVGTIKATVRAKQCIQGFGFEAGLVNFQTKKVAVDVDLIAEDCYTGVSIGAPAAESAIPLGTHIGIKVKAQTINCQKDVFLGRAYGLRVETQIVTTKTEAERRLDPRGVAWFAADPIVEGLRCTYAKNSQIIVTGNKGTCAYKAQIGGVAPGASGLSGATQNCDIFLDIAGTASAADVFAVNSGGNTMSNCRLEVTPITSATLPTEFAQFAQANTLLVGNTYKGSFTGTLTGVDSVVTGTINWSQNGNVVTLSVPELIGVSNTTAAAITGLPSDCWPSVTQYPQLMVFDNSTTSAGRALVTPAGAILLNKLGSSVFTAAGGKGLPDVTFSYLKF